MNRVIRNVTIVTPRGNHARKGSEMAELEIVPEGMIVIVDGIIEYAG